MANQIDTEKLVDSVVYSDMPSHLKLIMLESLEPVIESEWAAGNTAVKPASLITVDDLTQ